MSGRFLFPFKRIRIHFVLVLLVALALCGCASTGNRPSDAAGPSSAVASSEASVASSDNAASTNTTSATLAEDASYSSKDEVALYLHTYGHLPPNYITKKEAQSLGWDASKGNLHKVAPGMSIGGDRFGNREGLLPDKKGRQYYECDIDYEGGSRNAKRIVYSDDGLVFYTEDHYASFEQLY